MEGRNDAASLHPDSEGKGGGIRRWRCLPEGAARGRDALPIPCATGGEKCCFHRSPLPADVRTGLPAGHPWCLRPDYINIPDVKKRGLLLLPESRNVSAENAAAGNSIVDCGSSMAPDIERIIALKPEAILLSPFENSGGYGKLDKLHMPIIGLPTIWSLRHWAGAEWMKFYGMLFK